MSAIMVDRDAPATVFAPRLQALLGTHLGQDALWEEPDAFRPERWDGLDPDALPGYLPFGHAAERCWGRHMVMPLAERLLDLLRGQGLVADPQQRRAAVPLTGLLGVAQVDVVRHARA